MYLAGLVKWQVKDAMRPASIPMTIFVEVVHCYAYRYTYNRSIWECILSISAFLCTAQSLIEFSIMAPTLSIFCTHTHTLTRLDYFQMHFVGVTLYAVIPYVSVCVPSNNNGYFRIKAVNLQAPKTQTAATTATPK